MHFLRWLVIKTLSLNFFPGVLKVSKSGEVVMSLPSPGLAGLRLIFSVDLTELEIKHDAQ